MFVVIMVLSCIGALLSLYAYIVEQKTLAQPLYKASCDLSETISCSKPVTTGYNRLVGISNALLGLFFYIALGIFAFFELHTLISIAIVIALLGTMFFAYILFFKVRAFCPLCISTYIVNIILFVTWFFYKG
jgi:vitamin-K-epoxide reductase (warfarin-sensitive)